ncbi:nitroreductase family deazaflavin-dependent oxidoreductase [Nocardia sp. NPDC003963]
MSDSADPGSPRQYAPGRLHRLENTVMTALTRAGLIPHSYVLTTYGRRTGRPRRNPVLIVEHEGRRWLVAPYGAVGWVHNARAAGSVRLTRRRTDRDHQVREVSAAEAGPVLRRYIEIASATRDYFLAGRGDPVERFVAEAERHPVFELLGPGR